MVVGSNICLSQETMNRLHHPSEALFAHLYQDTLLATKPALTALGGSGHLEQCGGLPWALHAHDARKVPLDALR